MAIIGQNAYLERDRYYRALVVVKAGLSGGDLSNIFKASSIWWWEIASGELEQRPGFEWHYAYLKNVGTDVRPSGIAKVLAPSVVVIDDADVGKVVSGMLSAGELVADLGMGFDPAEGATLVARDALQPGAYYTATVEWESPAAVPTREVIVSRLKALDIAVFDIDQCLPTFPMPFLEGHGNLIADTVTYYDTHPEYASFMMMAGNTDQTAKKIRDALVARNVYILRKPFLGSVEGQVIATMCAKKIALGNVAFGASRFVNKAVVIAGEIADPSYIPALIGIGAGLGVIWLGAKVLGWEKAWRR